MRFVPVICLILNHIGVMKTICKYLSVVCVLALTATAAHAQLSVGAGYDFAKMYGSGELFDEESNELETPLHGFYIGADYNIGIWKGLGIAPGLQYEFTNGNIDKNTGAKFQEHYLNVPIDINYRFRIADGFAIGVSLVPSFNIGLASEVRQEGNSFDLYDLWGSIGLEDLDVKNPYGRFDFMLGIGVSADLFEHLRIKIRYDLGLVNRLSGLKDIDEIFISDIDIRMNRNRLQVGVAYLF